MKIYFQKGEVWDMLFIIIHFEGFVSPFFCPNSYSICDFGFVVNEGDIFILNSCSKIFFKTAINISNAFTVAKERLDDYLSSLTQQVNRKNSLFLLGQQFNSEQCTQASELRNMIPHLIIIQFKRPQWTNFK